MSARIFNPIPESELIITERGTIYHLDLAPENLAQTVITVGDPGRVKEVSKYFDSITHTAHHREFISHTGYIGKKHLTVLSSGIGPDNIDIVMNELDALVNIDFHSRTIKEIKTQLSIIRLGTCGSLQKDVPVDAMVVASHGLGLDNLLQYYKHENTHEELYILQEFHKHAHLSSKNIHPYIAEGAISLRKHFGPEFVHGITATCPGFYGPQGRLLRLPLAFPHLIDALTTFRCYESRITNFEMETSAIYGLGRLLGHKCLSVNTVVANRVSKTFSKNATQTIEDMIRKSLEIIAGI
jgi:uridine phosphorylase